MGYLSFEEYRSLWDLVSHKPFLTGFPLHLDVELTSHCNLRCKMCFQQHMDGKRTNMTETLFKKIVDEGVEEGLCAMKLQSRGESLIHPKIYDLLAYAKEKGILDIHLTTNGLLLNEETIRRLMECRLDLLILSFDQAHAEAAAMSEGDYTDFMQSIVKVLHRERTRDNAHPLKIRIQTCIADYSPEKIMEEEKRNRSLFPEANLILINPVYVSYEEAPHLMNLGAYEFYPCSYLWQRLTIYADGSVTTCSRDYNSKYNRIGNVKISTVKELWHSPALQDLRKRHLEGKRKEFHICALCENYLLHRETKQPGAGCTGIVYPIKEGTL